MTLIALILILVLSRMFTISFMKRDALGMVIAGAGLLAALLSATIELLPK